MTVDEMIQIVKDLCDYYYDLRDDSCNDDCENCKVSAIIEYLRKEN